MGLNECQIFAAVLNRRKRCTDPKHFTNSVEDLCLTYVKDYLLILFMFYDDLFSQYEEHFHKLFLFFIEYHLCNRFH